MTDKLNDAALDALIEDTNIRADVRNTVAALRADNARLRQMVASCATYSIDRGFSYRCRFCGAHWKGAEVAHAPGCLAAPQEKKG